VPQTLGRGVRTGDLRRFHNGADNVPAFCPAPVPQPNRLTARSRKASRSAGVTYLR
jgi:hypothetical protein